MFVDLISTATLFRVCSPSQKVITVCVPLVVISIAQWKRRNILSTLSLDTVMVEKGEL